MIDIPNNDVDEYRLILEAKYNRSFYVSPNYVALDNLVLRSCSHEGKLLLLSCRVHFN